MKNNKRRYEELKKNKQCVVCAKKLNKTEKYTRCLSCRRKQILAQRRYEQKKKETQSIKLQVMEVRKCVRCKAILATNNKRKSCPTCLRKDRNYHRRKAQKENKVSSITATNETVATIINLLRRKIEVKHTEIVKLEKAIKLLE